MHTLALEGGGTEYLPDKKIAESAVPSRCKCATPLGSVTKNQSEILSVTSRLISSGMVMSPLRSPASTCATGMFSFFATMEQASVEFTSPTTSTASARSALGKPAKP